MLLTAMWKNPIKNIEGKGENAGYQHFLLFPQCFPPYQREMYHLNSENCRLQMLIFEKRLKFCRLLKGYN